jgi:hypothetical protein
MSLLGDLFMLSPLFFFFACLAVAILTRIRPRKLRPTMETRGRQTRIPEDIMSDEYPYLKRYDEETIQDMELELYGESTAELDLQDEEDDEDSEEGLEQI